MKLAIKNILYFVFILCISCSSSSDDDLGTIPPLETPTPNPSSTIIKLIEDKIEGTEIIVVGSEGSNFMVSFENNSEGFEVIQNALPIVMKDASDNEYNIFGEIVSGPDLGQKLTPLNAYIGYWFSWGTFYPGLEIYNDTKDIPNQGQTVQGTDDWLIPKDQVFQGAAKDGIPAISNPKYIEPKNNNLNENELIIGVRVNGSSKGYPHSILNWHEIVNDEINGISYAVVFCPLTGTATTWSRTIDGEVTTFGVSGFLYNSNVVPYDRKTNSNWSQMLQKSVQGTLSGQNTQNLMVLETTLATWNIVSGSNQILSTDTGFNRDYHRNPYGSYPTNSSINFPINFDDNRLHPKERVLGVVVNGIAKAYRFESFRE